MSTTTVRKAVELKAVERPANIVTKSKAADGTDVGVVDGITPLVTMHNTAWAALTKSLKTSVQRAIEYGLTLLAIHEELPSFSKDGFFKFIIQKTGGNCASKSTINNYYKTAKDLPELLEIYGSLEKIYESNLTDIYEFIGIKNTKKTSTSGATPTPTPTTPVTPTATPTTTADVIGTAPVEPDKTPVKKMKMADVVEALNNTRQFIFQLTEQANTFDENISEEERKQAVTEIKELRSALADLMDLFN